MTSLTRRIVLLLGVAASTEAFAQTPRPPLGPCDVSRQFPLGLQQQAPSVASDSIAVTNLGDSALQFSFWDGAEWKPLQLSSRPNRLNGATNRITKAQTGTSYGLFWAQVRLVRTSRRLQ
jgi:hypothetical protein